MAKFYDVTDWNEKRHFQTKGTRSKSVVEEPETSDLYFFKTSMNRPGRNYKYEFWSEILASEIGHFLGFNLLKYDIACKEGLIGCISKNMCLENESLVEGVSLLTAYDNTYNPKDKDKYSDYTFQLIYEALRKHKMISHVDEIIRIILFDSIIGNSDRHQENWGIISKIQKIKMQVPEISKFEAVIKKIKGTQIKSIEIQIRTLDGDFAPIYDSGCCLAREILDDKIEQILSDNIMFEGLINRAKTEIRWKGIENKIRHFELIKKIKDEYPSYKNIIENQINIIIDKYDEQCINDIINNIDNELPRFFREYKLPEKRKLLISKIIKRRINILKEEILS